MTGEPLSRKRDAAATREALLDAAAVLFAERGFDRTTVRDIAKHAGANQALLFRYFGSKELLFEEVITRGGRELIAATPPEKLLEKALRSVLSPELHGKKRDHSLEAFLRSTGSGSASSPISKQLGDEYANALAKLTDAADAELRADLMLAWVLGIGLVRDVTGREPLASADPDEICRLVLLASRALLERTETP
ncbi:DNA-binding transcriptional regulator, AcrR family [Amycolatopsis xylanica]|uniref:DNA-binding transcriptional regulator, AcrR family n=1 Tax=Amycolatopsis xylanica TaxID=589385 RepID=A0A1H3N320_9PSEU|nr:TetR/AcrR family transcriptional regulator [Amycolatopsis xylanica]SDY83351.1 DNA-binding transcriptional regulator, AcrR family [Amycolatopsis xylanica]